MRNIVIAMVFQVGWFACVLSGAHGQVLNALAAAAVVVACNLWLTRKRLAQELRLIAWCTLVGLLLETANLATGVFKPVVPSAHPWLCPVWLLLLWTMFATVLRGPLGWLSGRYGLSALLGALFAAPNYVAGARLGAVTLNANGVFSVAMLVVLWALAMPLLVWLAGRGGAWKRLDETPSQAAT